MKKLINKPEDVVKEALAGMQAAHSDLISVDIEQQVIVRKDAPVEGKVGVISGGGSGHEPMHGGFVGFGMLDAACPGAGSIEHAKADKPTMHRLVSATTAGNNPYFSLNRSILAHNDLLLNIYTDKVGMSSLHASKRLLNDIFWFIDQFLHVVYYPFFGGIEMLPITCSCSTASC